MRTSLVGTVWRLIVFAAVAVVGLFAMLAIFAQLRFDRQQTFSADFTNVTGLKEGNFVRIAGVEVGKVVSITMSQDGTMRVEFSVDDSVVLTGGSKALVRYENLIGGRYLALEDGAGDLSPLAPHQIIGLDRTAPALDLDALIGGFRPLFRALDPVQVNALSGQLIQALQGQGPTIASFLAQTAALTATLADRDRLIGDVIVNLNQVFGSLADHNGEFATTVDALAALVSGLAQRGEDIATGIANANAAAASVADLLTAVKQPAREVIAQTDRVAGLVVADRDYVDDLVNTLPEAYQALGRQGIYGDYFSFYLCDAVLKMNGKGGQPVYVKVAGQPTGRCAPK